ncbi:hypothetical protein M438DRAFT_387727 [Aureobasidium pullulans EXF-150]|uniref:Uncharacterized protein n=1 Tax=Aureobasidium pullulans EXF-150 TaxID=1043002 RepID=A0A074XXV0_AURPU|nr:uncharacterized protein M438DRAFT_387727 [Aureobasidium pullulans EXF-150]KEQ79496.1 hypothetical protein M438DRAFT_387727 [Aureobasidium pullulans EXF-150]
MRSNPGPRVVAAVLTPCHSTLETWHASLRVARSRSKSGSLTSTSQITTNFNGEKAQLDSVIILLLLRERSDDVITQAAQTIDNLCMLSPSLHTMCRSSMLNYRSHFLQIRSAADGSSPLFLINPSLAFDRAESQEISPPVKAFPVLMIFVYRASDNRPGSWTLQTVPSTGPHRQTFESTSNLKSLANHSLAQSEQTPHRRRAGAATE